jgi:hypothetical protein
MRAIATACLLVVVAAPPVGAQEWTEYRSVEDGFHALFPGTPTIRETTFKSQAGFVLPERVYAVDKGTERYSIRVIDYRNVEQMGAERAKKCPAGAEPCLGNANLAGIGYWRHDVRGAPTYVLLSYLAKGGQVTDMFWNQLDLVSGTMFQLTNPDRSRTFVYIAMHEMRLYVAEATVPAGSPEPAIFTQAIGWLDKEGRNVRYQRMYFHEVHGLREAPVPPYGGGGGGGRGGAPAGAGQP